MAQVGRIFGRDPVREVDEEIGFHVEARVRDYVARGMEEASARRAALESVVLLAIVSAIVVMIGFVATLEPARRGLRIQPTEALRTD